MTVNITLLPTFFLLGAAKAGTTSLYYYLKQHPQIFLPLTKEPHFFDHTENYEKGIATYLKNHFQGAEKYSIRGEATPAYFHKVSKVAPRLAKIYARNEPRFIVILRDPVQRAWSHYLHKVRLALETESFDAALLLEADRLKEGTLAWVGYYSDGLYAQHIKKWLTYFDKNCFLFLLNEDLKEYPNETLATIFDFLGADSSVQINTTTYKNVASYPKSKWLMTFLSQPKTLKQPFKKVLPKPVRIRIKHYLYDKNLRQHVSAPQMPDPMTISLRKQYSDDIKELEKIIDRDLSQWLN